MNNKDRKLLLKNRIALVESLEANDLLGYLFQDGVLSENDREKIEVQPTRRDRIELLLDTLPRKGPKAFDRFAAVLSRLECYQYLAKILNPKKYDSECADPVADAVGPVGGADVVDASPAIHNPTATSMPKSDTDVSESYVSTSNPRGWCFILNNMHFYKHADREGSERDAHNLRRLFSDLGFRVWLVNDADAQDIREHFRQLALKRDHNDSLVVCILSHGLAGQIYGIDGELVSVSEILTILNSGRSRTLLSGKPKLFLIQACRNAAEKTAEQRKEIDSSHVITGGSSDENSGSLYESFIKESVVQAQSDIILAYSTFPGQVSWRHALNGSFFIDAVVSVFREHTSCEDVLNMLVKVNARVRESVGSMQQIPAPVFTLTKKWYLHPP